jgi:hypothetical protein
MEIACDIGYALIVILVLVAIIRIWKDNKKEENNWNN